MAAARTRGRAVPRSERCLDQRLEWRRPPISVEAPEGFGAITAFLIRPDQINHWRLTVFALEIELADARDVHPEILRLCVSHYGSGIATQSWPEGIDSSRQETPGPQSDQAGELGRHVRQFIGHLHRDQCAAERLGRGDLGFGRPIERGRPE
jgi:hypothetical protein